VKLKAKVKLEPLTGHSAFAAAPARGKTLEEAIREMGIDSNTNDFFKGLANWGLRDRAIKTFFREIGAQYSAWQNDALIEAFNCAPYDREDDTWEGDDRRYPLCETLQTNRRLNKKCTLQCAIALKRYAENSSAPSDHPPSFPNIKNRDKQGIQYLFLNWVCIECVKWNPTLGDVFLKINGDVSTRVRAALRSPQWTAKIANQLARIDYNNYSDDLLGLIIKLLALNWPEIKAGSIDPMDLVNDVLAADKAIFSAKAARTVPKLFDQALGDRWNDGIEEFAERARAKIRKFREVLGGYNFDRKRWDVYTQKQWDDTGTEANINRPVIFFASNLITEDIPNQSMSNLLKLLY